MHEGIGASAIHSHRAYGKDSVNEMTAWLKKNTAETEKNLLKWDAIPAPPSSALSPKLRSSL